MPMPLQVGRDAYAGMLRSALADNGVDTSLLYTVDGSSGTAIILLQPSGGWRLGGSVSQLVGRCRGLPRLHCSAPCLVQWAPCLN